MDEVIAKIFNQEHVIVHNLPTNTAWSSQSTRIKGIACAYCEKLYTHDAQYLIDHLQYRHGLTVHEIIPKIR